MNKKITKRILSGVASTCVAACITVTVSASNSISTNSKINAQTEAYSDTSEEVKDEMYTWIYNNLSYPNLNNEDKQGIIEEYIDSSEFLLQYQHNKEAALDTIITRLAIDERISEKQNQGLSRSVSSNGSLFSCSVDTSIVQEKNTWCGVGSTLMALTGISSHSSHSLVLNYTKPTQTQISEEVIPQGQTTAFVYAIKDYLNSQLHTNASSHYTYTPVGNQMTVTEVTNYIKYSLAADRPVILNAAPYGTLSYYNGSGISSLYRHYIVVDGYNRSSDTFWVADCTYLSNYQGRHYNVPASEIRDCLTNGGYIIHA